MSLVALGSDETGQIPYSVIKDTLRVSLLNLSASGRVAFISWLTLLGLTSLAQINDDEVEPWVVKAITAKLIDCKLDQMNQLVIVR